MTVFAFTQKVNDPLANILSAALGADANNPLVQNDVGKAVKIAANNNYVLCVAGDEIEGFVNSVEPFTVNGGYGFGGVQTNARMEATVGASQLGSLSVGDLVVADNQAAVGTAGGAQVQSGTPANFKWRVIRIITGTGATGDTVLLERV